MGFMTNLVQEKNQQKMNDETAKAESLKNLLMDDSAKPEHKEWAMNELTKSAGLSPKESQNLLGLMSLITGGAGTNMGDTSSTGLGFDPDTVTNTVPLPKTPNGTVNPIDVNSAAPPSVPAKKSHPWRDFLVETAASGLSFGKTEDYLMKQRAADAEANRQQRIRIAEENRQPGLEARRAAAVGTAMIPVDVARTKALQPLQQENARQEAILRAKYSLPPNPPMLYNEDGPVPARYILDTKDPDNPKWNLEPIQIQGETPGTGTSGLTVGAKPEFKIIGDPHAGPYAIQLPNGRVVAPTDSSVPPRARTEFDMAKAAHDKGVEEEATLGFKNDIIAHMAANPGMSREDATREVAIQHEKDAQAKRDQKSDAQIAAENAANERTNVASNRVRDAAKKPLDAIRKDVDTHLTSLDQAKTLLDSGSSLSLSLLAPSLLKALVGGAGSGVRITQAEINMVTHSTTTPETLKVQIEKWLSDPAKYKGVAPITIDQARELVDIAYKKARAKADILDAGDLELARITGTEAEPYTKSVIGIRKRLNDVDTGPTSLPKPPRPGAALDAATAKLYLDAAGGDKQKAFDMATQAGWKP